ncbi:MAG: hypothetical protein NC541_13840 [bacterium]|nr:hypothetical protein [bacterium]
MQLGGIGDSHGRESHQVTDCMHIHEHYKKEPGGAAASSSTMSSQAFQTLNRQQDAQMSLSAWLEKLLGSGKSLLKGIWGVNEVKNDAALTGDKTGAAQMMASLDEREGQDAGRAGTKSASLQENPYFLTVAPGEPERHMPPLQRIRTKVRSVTGQLAGKLPGRFFRFQAKNSFQARPDNRPKEDLRKHSKYRKDELEIDCILTDESYLMDSYDRKGEYSRLTTKK